jgi:hypothetical protein
MKQKENDLTQTSKENHGIEEKTKNPQTKESKPSNKNRKLIIILAIVITVVIIALIIVLCIILRNKKKEDKITENYIAGIYRAQKGIPLKLFNPSRLGLSDQNYTLEEIGTNNTRRLQEFNITDGVITPEITGTIQIKLIFKVSLTSLDFMFEGCSDLIKLSLTKFNSSSITSMIYTFTNCINLETVDFTSFSSSKVEKMDFLFGGCKKLVNIKGFENLDTSSLQKTAGMFLECTNLISVNLSAFHLNNIPEQNGMFIENPSLEKLDIGNTSDINGIFSSTENFKVTIISSASEVNSSSLNGEFSRITREENQQLNCTLRNMTEFTSSLSYLENITDFPLEEIIELINSNDFYISQDEYDAGMEFLEYDCTSLNYSNMYFNLTECLLYKRFYRDVLKEFEKCSECDEGERRMYCKSCFKGFYVPKGIDFSPTKCKRCNEGCLECIPDEETDNSICISCEEKSNVEEIDYEENYLKLYKLYNGKCIKRCKIGLGRKMSKLQ